MQHTEFRLAVQELLGKYDGTTLLSRWQEAIAFGAGMQAADYWLCDSGGVVNIVWINSDGIRDLTMVIHDGDEEDYGDFDGDEDDNSDEDDGGADGDDEEDDEDFDSNEVDNGGGDESPLGLESMFNFVPLRQIVSFEVREGPNIAQRFGLGVTGNRLVHVIANSPRGDLYRVANTPSESDHLDRFLTFALNAFNLYSP